MYGTFKLLPYLSEAWRPLSSMNILQNISFCVLQKRECHTFWIIWGRVNTWQHFHFCIPSKYNMTNTTRLVKPHGELLSRCLMKWFCHIPAMYKLIVCSGWYHDWFGFPSTCEPLGNALGLQKRSVCLEKKPWKTVPC